MIIVGDGGHATVVRELHAALPVQYSDAWIFIAVGNNADRKREAREFTNPMFATLVHPSATISPSAEIGVGSVVMAGAVIQAAARLGQHCIVNTGATIDHHCELGDYVHIAPGAHLCGRVTVGDGTLVGVGVGIAPMAVIPPWSLIKARRLETCPTK